MVVLIDTSSFCVCGFLHIHDFQLIQIPDVFPVLAAANKTLVAKSRDSLTTRTLHSELLYNYSGSKHVRKIFVIVICLSLLLELYICYCFHQISESLKRCGISDTTSYILAARFGASADEVRSFGQ